MKNVISTIILIATLGVASAQTDQGGWLVGASSDFSFTSTKIKGADERVSVLNFDTGVGYFLTDNLAAGLSIAFNRTKIGEFKETNTSVGPFARYYLGGTFFVGAGYDFTSSKIDAKASGSLLSFEVGYPIWLGERAALEPSLNYIIGSGDLNEDQSTFGLAVGFNLYL